MLMPGKHFRRFWEWSAVFLTNDLLGANTKFLDKESKGGFVLGVFWGKKD